MTYENSHMQPRVRRKPSDNRGRCGKCGCHAGNRDSYIYRMRSSYDCYIVHESQRTSRLTYFQCSISYLFFQRILVPSSLEDAPNLQLSKTPPNVANGYHIGYMWLIKVSRSRSQSYGFPVWVYVTINSWRRGFSKSQPFFCRDSSFWRGDSSGSSYRTLFFLSLSTVGKMRIRRTAEVSLSKPLSPFRKIACFHFHYFLVTRSSREIYLDTLWILFCEWLNIYVTNHIRLFLNAAFSRTPGCMWTIDHLPRRTWKKTGSSTVVRWSSSPRCYRETLSYRSMTCWRFCSRFYLDSVSIARLPFSTVRQRKNLQA